MTIKILTAVTVAASVLAGASVAEAGNKRHGYGHGNHHNNHYWGGYYEYEPTYNCRYFFRKARHTGSRYWWKKYNRCISRY